jgi:hypothetical protein
MPRCSPRTVLNTNYVMGNGSSTLLYNGAVCSTNVVSLTWLLALITWHRRRAGSTVCGTTAIVQYTEEIRSALQSRESGVGCKRA